MQTCGWNGNEEGVEGEPEIQPQILFTSVQTIATGRKPTDLKTKKNDGEELVNGKDYYQEHFTAGSGGTVL